MKKFYDNTLKIDALKLSEDPIADSTELFLLFEDSEIERYFYEHNDKQNIPLPSSDWAMVLFENKQFDDLSYDATEIKWLQKLKSSYLKAIASQKPTEVWGIIQSLSPKDQIIKANLLDAMASFNDDLLKQTVDTVCDCIINDDFIVWAWTGEPAAEIMVKLASMGSGSFNQALKIANLFLPIEQKKNSDYFQKPKGNLKPHDYNEFLEKYYVKLSNINPLNATELLLDTLKFYIESKESESEDTDKSFEFQIRAENFDKIDSELRLIKRDPQFALLQHICKNIKQIATSGNEEEIKLLLNKCESNRWIIFERLKLYTLRYTNNHSFSNIINLIISNFENFNKYLIRNEYNSLFNENFDLIDDEIKSKYLNWISNLEVTKDDIESYINWLSESQGSLTLEAKENAIEAYINGQKARKLYPLKNRFVNEYKHYAEASKWEEDAIKPRPSISSNARWVDPSEGSPVTDEEFLSFTPDEALEFLKNPENYSESSVPKGYYSNTPINALRNVFAKSVSQKHSKYLDIDVESLFELPQLFIRAYFRGMNDCFSNSELSEFNWQQYFVISQKAIELFLSPDVSDNEYIIFTHIARTVENFWDKENFRIELNETNLKTILSILSSLMNVPEKEEEKDEIFGEGDPVQTACNKVTGITFDAIISLAVHIKSKHQDKIDYNSIILPALIENCDFVLNKLNIDYTLAVFGQRLTQVYYSNKDWFRQNYKDLLYSDGDLNVVWDTYLTWTRPYKELFMFLVEMNVYQIAIGKLNKDDNDTSDEEYKPATHLGRHLVISYFHNWLDDNGKLLNSFYNKASVSLRRATNNFFTTGFQSNESPEDFKLEEKDRIIKHWENRLSYFAGLENKSVAKEEATSLVEWIKKCPIKPDKALELLSKTLDYTEGTLGEDDCHYVPEFIIEGICQKGIGHELKALECLIKFSKDPNLGTCSGIYEDDLISFIQHIIGLDNDYPNLKEIRKEACKLLDNYGRAGIYFTKEHYFTIKDQLDQT